MQQSWRRLVVVLLVVGACSESSPSGELLYTARHDDGNTFACATCHALSEPAVDGVIRPGHPIGDATRRPNFKNGQLTRMIDAVNTCRTEWMGATAWTDDDPEWLALREFLDANAARSGAPATAPALSFAVVAPPAVVTGGDPGRGRDVFNGRCIVCHGADAVGTERAPPLTGSLLEPEYIAERVRTSGSADSPVYRDLTGGRMPFWSASRLSDAELLDIVAFVDTNVPGDPGPGGGSGQLRDCTSTHPKIGETAVLQTHFHQVSGTATIIDDCTIEITNFNFDGQGIDARFYGGLGGDFINGFAMGEDLRKAGGYTNETLVTQLPETMTLDDLDGLSVWCVPARVSFGDGPFAP